MKLVIERLNLRDLNDLELKKYGQFVIAISCSFGNLDYNEQLIMLEKVKEEL
jgi:hypothetical protein